MGSMKTVEIDKFPSEMEFAVFSSEEVKRLSVVKVITGQTFDAIGHPLPGGLYDGAMGTYGRNMDPCRTCLNRQACPGHIGHIELDALVFNPFFIKLVHKILSVFCLHCHKLQMKDHIRDIVCLQLRLIDAGYVVEAQELEIFKMGVARSGGDDELEAVDNSDVQYVHPLVASMMALLKKPKVDNDDVSDTPKNKNTASTKTSCSIRAAIVHSAMQKQVNVKCSDCRKPIRPLRYLHRKLVYYMTVNEVREKLADGKQTSAMNKVIFADECRKILRTIYSNYSEYLQLVYPILQLRAGQNDSNNSTSAVDMFFMDTIPVTPPKARPSNMLRDQIIEHQQTTIYRNVIQANAVVGVIIRHMKDTESPLTDEARRVIESSRGETPYDKFYNAWQALQTAVDMLLDVSSSRDVTATMGLKQVLEKKEGLIRKHMMGKRVNYAARTVITPDPNICVDEVGIPDVFARTLSYPVPVTPWNVAELRKMVMNGPNVHPGANYIQDEKGYTTIIPGDNASKRESMAKLLFSYPENGIKFVHRHVLNGDPLLLNRQPSLHKPSIMAHRARILSGEKTFRLHYSNCKSYNADFDGDEMNAHYPQNEVARSEARNLVNVANNYLVPKDGTPLGGLIQDHVISGVKLSLRGRFFNREDYQQLVYQGLSNIQGDIRLLPPTILKPMRLWSGKQILSTIIINLIPPGLSAINLQSTAKIQSRQWNVAAARIAACARLDNEQDMSESVVIIRHGELLTGVLDKQQYGATTYGLIHCMYELYGGEVSTKLLTSLTKVFTIFLQREGFTLGVQDILVTAAADGERHELVEESRQVGTAAVAAALEMKDVPEMDVLADHMAEGYIKNPKFRVVLDRMYKKVLDGFTNDINRTCLPNGLISCFPHNNLQLMVLSGAKGSLVNTMQISCLLGQIELEGKRPPLMISGKSLPSFTAFEMSPKSGGFIDGRFMTGIQPQDFFFHCMAGREGLIDTAVKTSRSGYLQRCLVKHLEGLSVHYDLTVRDSDGTVVQYLYGEDGIDILKSKYFNRKFAVEFLSQNADVVLRPEEVAQIKDEVQLAKVRKHNKKLRSWLKKHQDDSNCHRQRLPSTFALFSAELRNDLEVKRSNEINPRTGRRRLDEAIIKLWKKADAESKETYRKKNTPCPDPITAIHRQDNFYGSVSETVNGLIADHVQRHPEQKDLIADILYVKNMKSLTAPGEPVGLLAAQSIGEPSTQMTLNTFHFAGRGEMNVTLGIPRLREILMLASSKIKTPSMDMPIKKGMEREAEKLRIKLNRVTLANVLHYVKTSVRLEVEPEPSYVYTLHFELLPRDAYQDDFCVRPKSIIRFMSKKFFDVLLRTLVRNSKQTTFKVDIEEEVKTAAKERDDDEEADATDLANGNIGRNKTKKMKQNGDDDDDSSEDENDEDDATGIKLKARKHDEANYDDPDDVEELNDANKDDAAEDDVEFEDAPLNGSHEKDDEDSGDALIDNVLKNDMVREYVYDKEHYRWCRWSFSLSTNLKKPDITSILRTLASKFVIHEVTGINRAIIYTGVNDTQLLKTDGINIVEMFAHNKLIDLNRLYSNDIHGIAQTYGIEAAVQVIIKEVENVFKVYGITVDRRHLSLIADYMTFDGTFKPMSRKGMEHSASPLQQMSFESCLQFLKNATGSGLIDDLNSPSSRLMVGLPVRNGTGSFELITKIC